MRKRGAPTIVRPKGHPDTEFKVIIHDKKPLVTRTKTTGPFSGMMSVGDIMSELKASPNRDILKPNGEKYVLTKLQKFYNENPA